MTRTSNPGRRPVSAYSRVAQRASVAGSVVALAWALGGGCTPLPDEDDDAVKSTVPTTTRDPSDDAVAKPIFDPCKESRRSSDSTEKQKAGKSKTLYTNDFERPSQPVDINCADSLDKTPVNTVWRNDKVSFVQFGTVETVSINDRRGYYKDKSKKGGLYSLGMLKSIEDDKLAMIFDTDLPYLNVGIDISGIAFTQGCGEVPKISAPKFSVSLYDTPDGKFDPEKPGIALDTKTIEGSDDGDPWTFDWRTVIVSLDASKSTSGKVTVMFNLIQGGYAALDNLSIVASAQKGVVDRDNNGVPDDTQCDEEPDSEEPASEEPDAEEPAAERPEDEKPVAPETTREEVDAGTPTTSRTRRDGGR